MSSGLDCWFHEKEPGKWYMGLEQAYGSKLDIEYDEYGPFPSFPEAHKYLHDNFQNPGGFSVEEHEHTDGTGPA